MAGERSKRKGLRVPVSFDLRCELGDESFKARALNLSTEGIFLRTPRPLEILERVRLEFLLPGTLSSARVTGETVWSRTYSESEEPCHVSGIKFIDLEEPYVSLIRDYTLARLHDEGVVRSQGILRVLDDIRNLPSMERLKAYHILIRKGTGPLKD